MILTWLLSNWRLAGVAALGLALAVMAGYNAILRADARQARAELELAKAQISVVAAAAATCSASVDQAKRTADAAIAGTAELVAAARRLKQPVKHTIERIERILEKPTPAGAGCAEAWDAIEAEQKARVP